MYTKPIVYKVFSFILAASAVCAFIGTIIGFFSSASKIFDPFGFNSIIHIIMLLVTLAITAWLAILEFTAMFTFAGMVEHEIVDDGSVFKRKLGFPGKVYRVSGSIVFYAALMAVLVAAVVLTVSYSVECGAFIAIPVLPLLIMGVCLFFVNVMFNSRYNAFGAVLDIKETDDPKAPELNRLKETKPNTLRAFCGILFGLCALLAIGTIICLFAAIDPLMEATGIESKALLIIALICGAVIDIVEMAIMGCFFDNLAKMQEKYLIKYRLL